MLCILGLEQSLDFSQMLDVQGAAGWNSAWSFAPKGAHNQICESSIICLRAFLPFFFFSISLEEARHNIPYSPSGLRGKAKDKYGWEMAQLSVMKNMCLVDTFILQLLPLGPSLFSQLAFADD